MKKAGKTFQSGVLLIAMAVYTVTAVNSEGYYHFDEHYQIIEFAGYITGFNQPDELAWEFEAGIRPALQPAIAAALCTILQTTGIDDPYLQALALRLLTMVLALVAITRFIRSSIHWVQPANQQVYIVLSYLLWFLPFLNVRFSSETWSGLLFLWATALVPENSFKHASRFLLPGFLLGLSFVCRFQSAFLIAGLFAWLVVVKQSKIRNILVLTGGIAGAVVMGICIDTWFYGEFIFTPWNYFRVNILQDVASRFGVAPWYHYVVWLLFVPGGVLLLISLLIVLFSDNRQPLLWIILPFFIVHSLIAHKENRFLFPLINCSPLLLILGWQYMAGWFSIRKGSVVALAGYSLLGLFALVNVAGLANTALVAAGNGTKAITHYIHSHYRDQAVNLIYEYHSNPYDPLHGIFLSEKFYRDVNVSMIPMEDVETAADQSVFAGPHNLWVIKKGMLQEPNFQQLQKKYRWELVTQSLPAWSEWLNGLFNPNAGEHTLLLFVGK